MVREQKKAPTKVRLTMPSALAEKLVEVAQALNMEPHQVGVMALSLGVRALDMAFVNPVSAEMSQAMDNRVDGQLELVRQDAGIKKES